MKLVGNFNNDTRNIRFDFAGDPDHVNSFLLSAGPSLMNSRESI